ncbi:MAG TPA: hypothetical protein VJB13_00765 [Candidatus Nanoarchaeia archaeon]|nr:hypothetical protein [Candidatus Nanoarchaeia archaeon]
MFSTKRGQSAAGAAVLIAIIAALIVGFVILIPPQDRAKLLEDHTNTSTGLPAIVEKKLLSVSPGRIDYLAEKEVEHPIPVVNVYARTEAKVLAEKNLAYAKKGVFSEQTDVLTVVVPDLKHTKNLLLSLEVKEVTGKLIILVNGDQVFNDQIKAGSMTPITVPQNLLKEQNTIIFAASSPGLAFWRTNEVSLNDIKVVADVTSVESQSSRSVFLVSDTEQKNLQKVVLKFQPSCKFEEVGPLHVSVNGKLIYSSVPDCDLAMVPIEFSPETLHAGENELVFRTEKGDYLLTHIIVKSELKEVEFPTYYFDLSYEEYRNIVEGDKRVRLTLNFVDVVARKFGDVIFNGNTRYFDTKEVSYTLDVSNGVVQGTNSLKIKPRKTLEVRELRADLLD